MEKKTNQMLPGEAALRAAYEKAYPDDRHFLLFYGGANALFETAEYLEKDDAKPALTYYRDVMVGWINADVDELMARFE
jgi:hypothetical protein